VPLHFTAFHPDWKMRDIPATPPATLMRARSIALRNGLHYVYTGNIHDADGASTYCHQCKTRVVERDWYELGEWQLDAKGACLKCGTTIPGVFNGAAGTWGRKRMPVMMGAV
jgi:pyruvate formate lyase activating enzyme